MQLEPACGLIELHRADADIEHDALHRSHACFGQSFGQLGKAARMEHEARRDFEDFPPGPPRRDRIGVAIEGVDGGAGTEQAASVSACAEGGVHDQAAGLGVQRGDNLIEEHGDMGFAHHLRAASAEISAMRARHADLTESHSGPIANSTSGAQIMIWCMPP